MMGIQWSLSHPCRGTTALLPCLTRPPLLSICFISRLDMLFYLPPSLHTPAYTTAATSPYSLASLLPRSHRPRCVMVRDGVFPTCYGRASVFAWGRGRATAQLPPALRSTPTACDSVAWCTRIQVNAC